MVENASEANRTVVGIDLGTSYTSIAVARNKKVGVLPDAAGHKLVPSIVTFAASGEVLVGSAAKQMISTMPSRTVVAPKRLLGLRFDDREVQSFLAQQPYLASKGPDGMCLLEIGRQQWAIPQVCAHLLTNARKIAETALGEAIDAAVIAVPVSFDDTRLAALSRAAQLAGFRNVEFIDEPTAAAVANRYVPGFGGVIGVYDFGGGTFDFSLVDVSNQRFTVLATSGDPWLGGDDIDMVMAEAAANQFWRQYKVDLRGQAVEWQRVRFACELAKRELGSADTATISVSDVLRTANGMVSLELQIDRSIFARAAKALIERSLAVCDKALRTAGLQASQLSAVHLSGGTSHLHTVRSAVAAHFGVPIKEGIAPDLAVCLGAAIEASMVSQRRPASLRAKTIDR